MHIPGKEVVDTNEVKVLSGCHSKFIVGYYDVIRGNSDLWV